MIPLQELISRYFDEDLSVVELRELQERLRTSPDAMRPFVRMALLHDRLHGELTTLHPDSATLPPASDSFIADRSGGRPHPAAIASAAARRRRSRIWALTFGLSTTLVVLVAIWFGGGLTRSSAATELQRIIAAQELALDRTYHIAVEESASIGPADNRVPADGRPRKKARADSARRRGNAASSSPGAARDDDRRPPKPPMDDAVLYVGRGGRFVLVRQTESGEPFVTGCDGRESWSVRPEGPVRVSSDLTRFSRDLPGHEHGMPLIQIEHALESLRAAYDIELLPIEAVDDQADDDPADDDAHRRLDGDDADAAAEATRLLVAVKKRGFRGPRRVEITYAVRTGLIRQVRFLEMPYGPDRLTLRLTLQSEGAIDAAFFEHAFHHAPDHYVERE